MSIALFGKPIEAFYYPNMYNGIIDTSGIMVMRYDGFVGEFTGAKDTLGENFFLIEGEQGYICIPNGSNGLAEIKVVTKSSTEVFNEQPDPARWYYEVQSLARLVLADDYDTIYNRLNVMLAVVETIETSRKQAGILFPGD